MFRTIRMIGVLTLFLALLSLMNCSGCGRLPTLTFNSPFGRSDWIDTRDARVLTEPTPQLQVTLANKTGSSVSLRIVIEAIGGRGDCQNSLGLDPKQVTVYSCPQNDVSVGRSYRAEITVYRDRGQTRRVERLRRIIEIKENEEGERVLVGRPWD